MRYSCLVIHLWLGISLSMYFTQDSNHDDMSGVPIVQANANELKRTIVSPHLECRMQDGFNFLWCSTFQVAWNQLCDLCGGPIRFETEANDALILNEKTITTDVLDPSSFVARAGLGPETIVQIKKELLERFSGSARPQILPSSISNNEWIAYAYLFQDLSFEYAFTRWEHPLIFNDSNVASFGINQYLPTEQPNEVQMASQVMVYDHRDKTDFIIELTPKNTKHRIILAHIPKKETLSTLIRDVQTRIMDSKPMLLVKLTSLQIPIIDFDILKTYSQLQGHRIITENPRMNGTILGASLQSVRFRLDEKGAILKSEAIIARSKARDLIFQGPFLVLLQKKGADYPYFALWIGNEELLVPFEQSQETN